MIFLNPWAWLGLLGIPFVIYIHMLQRRSRQMPVSTLFLLEAVQPERKAGRKIEKLKNSKLLWLNLLSVLLLTWLMVQPRSVQERKILKVAVVVDSSASMQVFAKNASETLFKELAELSQEASGLELTILSSIIEARTIYSGSDLLSAEKALIDHSFTHVDHDLTPAVRRAQSLLNNDGLLVLLSDHEREMPDGVLQILAGQATVNVGFTGFTAKEDGKWRAIVRNYSGTAQQVTWWAGLPNQEKLFKSEVLLEPGAMKTLQGEFFKAQDQLVLSLADDAFLSDNKICAVRPRQKSLSLKMSGLNSVNNTFLHKVLLRLARIEIKEQDVDFEMAAMEDEPAKGQVGIFWKKTKEAIQMSRGNTLSLNHPLMEGLAWQGVSMALVPSNKHFAELEGDLVLLKAEDQNLIILREQPKGPQVLLNMDLNAPEFLKSPAMIILLHRCLSLTRLHKKAFSRTNQECNNILHHPSWESSQLKVDGAEFLSPGKIQMPNETGFFSVREVIESKEVELMQGACFFADAGEADFSEAVKRNDFDSADIQMSVVSRESDFLKPLWVLSLLMICLYAWFLVDRKEQVKRRAFEDLA